MLLPARTSLYNWMFLGGLVVGAVLLVPLQGYVSHGDNTSCPPVPTHHVLALYRVWPVSSPEHDGPLAHHDQHDRRGHLLRPHPRPRHLHNTELGLLQETVQREGEATGPNIDLTFKGFAFILIL